MASATIITEAQLPAQYTAWRSAVVGQFESSPFASMDSVNVRPGPSITIRASCNTFMPINAITSGNAMGATTPFSTANVSRPWTFIENGYVGTLAPPLLAVASVVVPLGAIPSLSTTDLWMRQPVAPVSKTA